VIASAYERISQQPWAAAKKILANLLFILVFLLLQILAIGIMLARSFRMHTGGGFDFLDALTVFISAIPSSLILLYFHKTRKNERKS
jgi:magnesium-transporting ATPase (P-type)